MKKIILLFAVYFLLSGNLFAQKIHFGLGVTPSLAWIHPGSDDVSGDGSKIGFNYGLITEFAFTDDYNYAFATGLTVDSKGGKLRTKDVIVDSLAFHGEYTIRYVEIPLALKMKTTAAEGQYIRYYGLFGAAPGFLIGAKGTYKLGSTLITDNEDIKDDINNFNISLVIGLGIEYILSGNTNLLLGVVYKNGFSDIINGNDTKANANTIGLNAGILF